MENPNAWIQLVHQFGWSTVLLVFLGFGLFKVGKWLAWRLFDDDRGILSRLASQHIISLQKRDEWMEAFSQRVTQTLQELMSTQQQMMKTQEELAGAVHELAQNVKKVME